jgi:subtilisin family serine protease
VLTAAVPAGAAGRSDGLSRPSSLQPATAPVSTQGAGAGQATRVIVKYRPTATGSGHVRSLSAQGLRVRRTLRLTGAKLVDVPRGRSASDVAAQLRQDPEVEYAVPDVLRRPLANAAVPNDPHFGQQWGLRNTGQTLAASAETDVTSVAGVDVDALGAWGVASGSASVTVAVIDQGVDITHPDLAGAIWTNRREVPGNGRDDDGNGYVDDVHGWDFVGGTGAVGGAQDDDHGTHVAGIVGATRDNDEGIAGLASGVSIMPLKFMGAEGGYDSDAIDAIAYAKAMGAKVINASWGASVGDDPLADDPDLRDAISQCGCVFVAAAGNAGASSDDPDARIFPAAFGLPNELSVGALDASGKLASFSNYGSGVDLAAPGDAILSTLPGGYGWGGGTSMAAPFVSATAALMLSLAPTLSPEEVVSRIAASVTRLPALSGKVRTGGMLDAGAAMRSLAARVVPERLQGADRYATAAAVSTKFDPGVAVAYVASGESFPDALAGAALAGSTGQPVLLTASTSLPTATALRLSALRPSRIVVLGGPGAVSNTVRDRLRDYTAGTVTRIYGADRYATAAAVAGQFGTGVPAAYVASGLGFPDALAGAALAGSQGSPVLLTAPTSVPLATRDRLARLGTSKVVILGGTGVVSSATATTLGVIAAG